MSSKKPRPILTKTSKSESAGVGSKGLIALIILLLIIVIGYFVWPRPLPSSPATTGETPTETQQNQAAQSAAMTENTDTIGDTDSIDSSTVVDDGSDMTDLQLPEAAAILNAPLPETDSLAKEEIDRLEDERKRLAEQEKLAAEQIAMNKQLTDMKAEQIALLEQQIAQLEASKQAEANAE